MLFQSHLVAMSPLKMALGIVLPFLPRKSACAAKNFSLRKASARSFDSESLTSRSLLVSVNPLWVLGAESLRRVKQVADCVVLTVLETIPAI